MRALRRVGARAHSFYHRPASSSDTSAPLHPPLGIDFIIRALCPAAHPPGIDLLPPPPWYRPPPPGIDIIIRACCPAGSEAIIPAPTFAMYEQARRHRLAAAPDPTAPPQYGCRRIIHPVQQA